MGYAGLLRMYASYKMEYAMGLDIQYYLSTAMIQPNSKNGCKLMFFDGISG